MSHHRKNSVRDKGIGKKWICLERYTFHGQNVVSLKRLEQPQGTGLSQRVRAAAMGERYSTECGPSQKARGLKI